MGTALARRNTRGQNCLRSAHAANAASQFCPTLPSASISVAITGRRQHGAEDDLQIEPERPVVDVEQVVLEAPAHLLVGVDLAAAAVDLRPAGDARLDVVAPRIERDALLVFVI